MHINVTVNNMQYLMLILGAILFKLVFFKKGLLPNY